MTSPFQLIRKNQLASYGIPLSASAVYARASAGSFPKPRKIGARASAWRSDELDAWKVNPAGWRAAVTP